MGRTVVSGNITIPKIIQEEMETLHAYLMGAGFPYHSVSVIYRPMDGIRCYFSNNVKDKITDDVKEFISSYKATYVVNN
jgi:hypothetical protein